MATPGQPSTLSAADLVQLCPGTACGSPQGGRRDAALVIPEICRPGEGVVATRQFLDFDFQGLNQLSCVKAGRLAVRRVVFEHTPQTFYNLR
jgi:hypothetical protein